MSVILSYVVERKRMRVRSHFALAWTSSLVRPAAVLFRRSRYRSIDAAAPGAICVDVVHGWSYDRAMSQALSMDARPHCSTSLVSTRHK
ncbi:MAG TPA: hypothetical protein VFH43_06030 [Candidatus Kapabacteria bacterium]|nr:hypothetical protein [Candidatus Kapabacteria bacterium]